MEVPGRKRDADVEKGSAEPSLLCQPCREDGKQEQAKGFCQNCKDYLCASCISYHGKLKVLKNHRILDETQMPEFYPASSKQEDIGCTEPCEDHANQFVKFYCPSHCELGCGDCVVLEHRTCKIHYIPDVAKDYKTGPESSALIEEFASTEKDLSTCMKEISNCLVYVRDTASVEIEKIREFRNEINAYLAAREQELLARVEEYEQRDHKLLEGLRSDCKIVEAELDRTKDKMMSHEENLSQFYITSRQAEKKLAELQKTIRIAREKIHVHKYSFQRDIKSEELLKSISALGIIQECAIVPTAPPPPPVPYFGAVAIFRNQ